MSSPSDLVKVSFSFYPADMKALNDHVSDLRETGVPVRRATVLRALIHQATQVQMFSYAALLAEAQRQKGGPREDDNVADWPTVDLPPADVKKLEDTVTELGRKNVPANRAFVVRALLRGLPRDIELNPMVRQFIRDFPDKPRGWAARNLQAKKHG